MIEPENFSAITSFFFFLSFYFSFLTNMVRKNLICLNVLLGWQLLHRSNHVKYPNKTMKICAQVKPWISQVYLKNTNKILTWMMRPGIRNINTLVLIDQSIKIMSYCFSSLDTSSIELLNMPLLCAEYRLYLVVLNPNCLTLLLASSLFCCKKCDLIFRQTFFIFFMFLLLSAFS